MEAHHVKLVITDQAKAHLVDVLWAHGCRGSDEIPALLQRMTGDEKPLRLQVPVGLGDNSSVTLLITQGSITDDFSDTPCDIFIPLDRKYVNVDVFDAALKKQRFPLVKLRETEFSLPFLFNDATQQAFAGTAWTDTNETARFVFSAALGTRDQKKQFVAFQGVARALCYMLDLAALHKDRACHVVIACNVGKERSLALVVVLLLLLHGVHVFDRLGLAGMKESLDTLCMPSALKSRTTLRFASGFDLLPTLLAHLVVPTLKRPLDFDDTTESESVTKKQKQRHYQALLCSGASSYYYPAVIMASDEGRLLMPRTIPRHAAFCVEGTRNFYLLVL
jgi:hypothetical protein